MTDTEEPFADDSIDSDSNSESLLGNEDPDTSQETPKQIGADYTKNIFLIRMILIGVILLSTTGVAVAVFMYVREVEQANFESSFEQDSLKLFEAVGMVLVATLGAVDTFALGMVSYSQYANKTWPFVTVPDFAVRGAKLISLCKATVVNAQPLVADKQRDEWEKYALMNDGWVNEGIHVQNRDENYKGNNVTEWEPVGFIYRNNGSVKDDDGPFLPTWQSYPVVPSSGVYNWDLLGDEFLRPGVLTMLNQKKVVISETQNLVDYTDAESIAMFESLKGWMEGYLGKDNGADAPFSDFYYPIMRQARDSVLQPENGTVVGTIIVTRPWHYLIQNILPEGSRGIHVVIGNKCNQSFTYEIDGPRVHFLGSGAIYETKYESMVRTRQFAELESLSSGSSKYTGVPLATEFCPYWIHIYPSQTMESDYVTTQPIIYSIISVLIFGFTSLIFIVYDQLVENRQRHVLHAAMQSSAIVSSLFPSTVRTRLFPGQIDSNEEVTTKSRLQSFLTDKNIKEGLGMDDSGPIADYFPDATVLFADIAGFTFWSSTRDPSHVFILLETIYSQFDKIAKRRAVFKVETIGDSYVAVCGLPEPNNNHAITMARFADDCRKEMNKQTDALEDRLGPGTNVLRLRFGLHSGPVTAGVIRGEKSRFQLFGDTVNTASRMESNGIKDKIHVSEATAQLIIAAGKSHWITAREDQIEAKGKGKLQTYWCNPKHHGKASTYTSTISSCEDLLDPIRTLNCRNAEWIFQILAGIVRNCLVVNESGDAVFAMANTDNPDSIPIPINSDGSVETSLNLFEKDTEPRTIPEPIDYQIRTLIETLMATYRDHPYHNFDHTTLITQTIDSILKKIELFGSCMLSEHSCKEINYPLVQFAIYFSCLIHDIDHPGVSNAQLIKEQSILATHYKSTNNVCEHNAFDISWKIFMDKDFNDLRYVLCPTTVDLDRLHIIVHNLVVQDDINDTAKKNCNDGNDEIGTCSVTPEAFHFIRNMIQTSIVAHTVGSIDVYKTWNERQYEEIYVASISGRADNVPVEDQYKQELHFFDQYVFPLVRRLVNTTLITEEDVTNNPSTTTATTTSISSYDYLLSNVERNRSYWCEHGLAQLKTWNELWETKYIDAVQRSSYFK